LSAIAIGTLETIGGEHIADESHPNPHFGSPFPTTQLEN